MNPSVPPPSSGPSGASRRRKSDRAAARTPPATPPPEAQTEAKDRQADDDRPRPHPLAPAVPRMRDHLVPLAVALGVLALDHLTKFWAVHALRRFDPLTGAPRVIDVIPGFFDFTYAENPGAAFSLFADHPERLTVVALGISLLIFWWYWQTPKEHKVSRVALALVLSGAVGNLLDRLFRGVVVDFIHVFWRQYHWPTFNVADSAICVGIGLLILWSFREQKTP